MTFTRTKSGLANRNIFTDSQITVYVESDPRYPNTNCLDIVFWSEFLKKCFGLNSVKVLPLGGKTHVVSVAKKIIDDNIMGSLCALDRDYDELYGRMLLDDRVFYTFGYGIENDLLCKSMVLEILNTIFPAENAGLLRHIVDNDIEQTMMSIRLILIADQIGVGRAHPILNRHKPTSDIDHSKRKVPVEFRTKVLLARVKGMSSKARCSDMIHKPVANWHMVPSHHLIEVIHHTVNIYSNKIRRESFNKSVLSMTVVTIIRNSFLRHADDKIREYYDKLGRRNISSYII